MPLPPPKKKTPPPPSKRHDYVRNEPRMDGLRFQPNRNFDSVDEINAYIAQNYKGRAKLIETWEVKVIRCIIDVKPEEKK